MINLYFTGLWVCIVYSIMYWTCSICVVGKKSQIDNLLLSIFKPNALFNVV